MISNELLLLLWGHGSKRIEGTSKFSLKAIASLDNLLLNLISLFLSDARSKRISRQVTTYSDASRLDHFSVFWIERWALKLGMVHVTDVTSSFGMSMVMLNDLVHHWCKGSIRIM